MESSEARHPPASTSPGPKRSEISRFVGLGGRDERGLHDAISPKQSYFLAVGETDSRGVRQYKTFLSDTGKEKQLGMYVAKLKKKTKREKERGGEVMQHDVHMRRLAKGDGVQSSTVRSLGQMGENGQGTYGPAPRSYNQRKIR